MHKIKLFFAIVLLLLAGVLPASGQFGDIFNGINKAKQIHDATQEWTPEQEEAVGRASAVRMIHVFGLYVNPAMTNYVNLVGNTVAQFGTRPMQYHFAILDTEMVNAFAMPGGYVFITRGALANISNESELAGVLAHEVAHVDGRHLERMIRDKKITGIAVQTGAEVGASQASGVAGFAAGMVDQYAAQAITAALTMNYGPDKERDADKAGTEFAAKAGYDPAGLRNFLAMLQQAASDPKFKQATGMLNGKTHPPLKDRVSKLTELSATYPAGGQVLEKRYKQNVNFESGSATASAATPVTPATTAAKSTKKSASK
ncbi:MAG TPA: M48 family metalloprotease [Terriglobales bacterium]|nr:M48 family metalloprotease [Terriglobales bacterium]